MGTRDREELSATVGDLIEAQDVVIDSARKLIFQARLLAEGYRDLYVEGLDMDPEENVLPWEPDPPCPGENKE